MSDDTEAVNCPRCGDFICPACGGASASSSQPPKAAPPQATASNPRGRRRPARALAALVVLAVLVGPASIFGGAVAAVAYECFLFGWELIR